MVSMLEKLRSDMKKAFKASLVEHVAQFTGAKESLANVVNNISDWERIFARATTEKDTKEVLQIFKVLQKDQAMLDREQIKLSTLKKEAKTNRLKLVERCNDRLESMRIELMSHVKGISRTLSMNVEEGEDDLFYQPSALAMSPRQQQEKLS